MLLAAFWNNGVTRKMIEGLLNNADSCIYGLSLTSIILIIELIVELHFVNLKEQGQDDNVQQKYWKKLIQPDISLYTLILSVISLLYGLVTAGMSRLTNNDYRIDPKLQLIFINFIIILWIIAAALCTFIGPFVVSFNSIFV